ncbi:MAG: hypothetical protein AAGE65_08905 [Planctomycetota bacterium]
MAWELIYTSASRGLAEGSRGFCTVAATAGMPASLIPRIEALSGYRPVPAEASIVAPIQFTHVRLDHAGQTLSVLSRIVQAGHDYSGRTNKLAHHVVLEPQERTAAGPADWMRRFADWRSVWDEPPRRLEPQRFTPDAGQPPEPSETGAKLWEEAAGDAGYAGFFAERFLLDPSRPTYLHHDPTRHDALALLDEAITVLPPEARWGATFATYFTDPLPESDAAWRCWVAGTPAAQKLDESKAVGHVIDLLDDLSELPATRYVNAARGQAMPPPSGAPSMAAASSLSTPAESMNEPPARNDEAIPIASAAPKSAPPVKSMPAASGHEAARVPAAWFWAAALGWPVVIGTATLLAWPGPPPRPDLSADTDPPSTAQAALVPPPPDEASRTLESLREQLVDAERQIAALTAEIQDAAPRTAIKPVTPPAVAVPVAQPTPHRVSTEASTPSAPPESKPPSRSAAEPIRAAVTLPAPTLRSSGSTGFGSLTALAEQRTVLWESASDLGVASVRVRAADLPASSSLGLAWRSTPTGVTLRSEHAAALGGTRSTVLAEAQWDATSRSLVWRWRATEIDRRLAAALRPLGSEAAASVWELRDASDRIVAEIQGVLPAQAGVRIGETQRPLRGHAFDGAIDPGSIRLEARAVPEGWRRESGSPSNTVVLRGAGDSELTLRLRPGPSGVTTLTSSWQQDAAHLNDRHRALADEIAHDRDWLDRLEQTQTDYEDHAATLPQTTDGQPDDTRRHEPDWLAGFRRLDALAEARGQVRGERDANPLELQASLRARERELLELDRTRRAVSSFPGVSVSLVLTTSDARLATVEVKP